MIELFASGFLLGASWMLLFGCIEGLFGDRALSILVGVFIAVYFASSVFSTTGSLALTFGPWQVYVGMIPGAVVGFPLSQSLKADIQRGGEPYVWSVMSDE